MTSLEDVPMARKDHERICVERFLEAIGMVPTLIEDSEAPDFRVLAGAQHQPVMGAREPATLRRARFGG